MDEDTDVLDAETAANGPVQDSLRRERANSAGHTAALGLLFSSLNNTRALRHFSVVATLFIKQDVVQERALLVLPAAATAVVAILRRSHSNVAAAVLCL